VHIVLVRRNGYCSCPLLVIACTNGYCCLARLVYIIGLKHEFSGSLVSTGN
jgi:hypothetical protein